MRGKLMVRAKNMASVMVGLIWPPLDGVKVYNRSGVIKIMVIAMNRGVKKVAVL